MNTINPPTLEGLLARRDALSVRLAVARNAAWPGATGYAADVRRLEIELSGVSGAIRRLTEAKEAAP